VFGFHHPALFKSAVAQCANAYLTNDDKRSYASYRRSTKTFPETYFPVALEDILSKVMLRHEKKQRFKDRTTLLQLPKKTVTRVVVPWGIDENGRVALATYRDLERVAKRRISTCLATEAASKRSHMSLYSTLQTLLRFCSCGYAIETTNEGGGDTKPTVPVVSGVAATACPKIVAVMDKLKSLQANDASSKVLIFTHFLQTQERMKQILSNEKIKHAWLDGSMSQDVRHRHLKNFAEDKATAVFLLTVRTGAVGINLTEANHIFLMDPSWNVALEAQAIGRAWRMGQRREVHVHRFVMEDTAESRLATFDHGENENNATEESASSNETMASVATYDRWLACYDKKRSTESDDAAAAAAVSAHHRMAYSSESDDGEW